MLTLLLTSFIAGLPQGARVILEHGDARVGTYVSSTMGFSTNTHWIEGPKSVVLIDTQFLPSAIEEATRWIEDTTGKKISLAIVLHANPDKFNGTGYLKARGVRVITSEQVLKLIPAVHEKRTRWFYERYKPDYPRELVLPESFGAASTEIDEGGLKLKLHVAGPGCSDAHVIVQFGKHVFPGDLVTNNAHAWLELGHVYAWLERLAELKRMDPDSVHPGRGASGGFELLVRQEAYLRRVIGLVAAEAPTNPPNEESVARVKSELEVLYPGYRFKVFLNVGVPGVFEALARPKP